MRRSGTTKSNSRSLTVKDWEDELARISGPKDATLAERMLQQGSLAPRMQELTGLRFGRLVVLKWSHRDLDGRHRWLCLCDCGNETTCEGHHLKRGSVKSCGCWQRDRTHEVKTTHGLSQTATYRAWISMRQRCNNPAAAGYSQCGGRGVRICARWRLFSNFLADLGPKPAGHILDRRDPEGDFRPENCRWSTPKESASRRPRTGKYVDRESPPSGAP